MKYIIILMTLVSAFFSSCMDNPDKEAAAKLDRLFTELFPSDEPGAAVLITRGGRNVFEKAYGIADISAGKPVDCNTFFNIASVSKQFTAVAVLQLAEQGKLSLEDPVSKYFPEYKADFWKKVKIKHLLAHSSGVPDARGGIPHEEKIKGDDKLAMSYLPELDYLDFEPGSAYEYINPTYVLCGAIVEKVSEQAFTEYMTEHVFLPAGMKRTLYFDPEKQDLIPGMAHGYEYADVKDMPEERIADKSRKEGPRDWYEYDYGEETFFATRPDGGIYTSVREFLLWEKALRENILIKEESRIDAHTPHTLVSGSKWSDYQNRPNTWYGYGWFIEPETDSDKEMIYHTGDNGGFKILAARFPADDAVVLIFANRADWDRYEVLQQVKKILDL